MLSYGNVRELDLSDEHGPRLDEGEPGIVEELVLILLLHTTKAEITKHIDRRPCEGHGTKVLCENHLVVLLLKSKEVS